MALLVVVVILLAAVLLYPFLLRWMAVATLRMEPETPEGLASRCRTEKGQQAALRLMRQMEVAGSIVELPRQSHLPWQRRLFTAARKS